MNEQAKLTVEQAIAAARLETGRFVDVAVVQRRMHAARVLADEVDRLQAKCDALAQELARSRKILQEHSEC